MYQAFWKALVQGKKNPAPSQGLLSKQDTDVVINIDSRLEPEINLYWVPCLPLTRYVTLGRWSLFSNL